MPGGYMGKILFVDLSTGAIREETPDERLYHDFVGGYGLGARILYSRQKAGVDPLGPDNVFGLVTGGLTGTTAAMGARYVAVGKSPLTGGWGDANSGGFFGPHLKFAGYDAVFFTGISERPVYLAIDNGRAELRDASHLWGSDCYTVESTLQKTMGRGTEVVCIGPAGEKLVQLACIVTHGGASAGRSGLGAVMGSKRLKAVAVRGEQQVPIADAARADQLRKEHTEDLRRMRFGRATFWETWHTWGTAALTGASTHSGDSPVKNWGGVGVVDLPDLGGLTRDAAIANQARNDTCWRCTLACEGVLRAGKGEYKYAAGLRRVEYETHAAFGSICGNNNIDSINMANDICNRYGLDTIAAGAVIAFAIECFENKVISLADTDGIELTWGNHQAVVAMTEKMAKREGFGDVLADGSAKAAARIGRGAEQYAVHIGGVEPGMHDPKLGFPEAREQAVTRFVMDATPGRHTQESFGRRSFSHHLVNASGLCMFGYMGGIGMDAPKYVTGFLAAVTGWERSWEELENDAARIVAIRQAFNSREGINPVQFKVPSRILGNPPQSAGPLAGIAVDPTTQIRNDLQELGWDAQTAKPTKSTLLDLGMDDVARDLWP